MCVKLIFFLLLLFIFFLPLQGYTADMLEDLLPPDEGYTKIFPQTIRLKGFIYTYNCEVSGPMEITIFNNPQLKQFKFKALSPVTKAELIFDKNLSVIKSETFFLKALEELIKKTGHDKRGYYRKNYGKASDTIVLTFSMGEKEKKRDEFSCDRNTVPSDAFMLVLHALLLKEIRENFLFDIISLEDSAKVRMSIVYYFTNNVLSLSDAFSFPQKIREAVLRNETYHVFEMKAYGLLNLFVWTRWFFVFKANYPYEFVAYWGGDGIYRETIFFPESEYIFGDK